MNDAALTGPIITLDVDWAPDFAINYCAELLIEANVRATWFVTHQSPAIRSLLTNTDLFELGIHPNFQSGSTMGECPREVLEFCNTLVPFATSMRSHGLLLSTTHLDAVTEYTGMLIDVSTYLPRSFNVPITTSWGTNGKRLHRLVYGWEDDFEMARPSPVWQLKDLPKGCENTVFDFHPLHVFLNGATMSEYEQAKSLANGSLNSVSRDLVEPLRSGGIGPGSMFCDVVTLLSKSGGGKLIKEFAKKAETEQ